MNPSTSLGTTSNGGMVNPSPSVRQAGNIRGLLLLSGVCRRSVSRGCAHVKYRCRCRVNKGGTNWFNVVIECHFNRGTAYDHCPRHPEADARARSTAAEVPGHVVRHDPRAAWPRQLPQLESLLRLL